MNVSPGFHSNILEPIGWVFVHSLWQFAAIAIVAMVLVSVLRRRSAKQRYRLLLVALAIMSVAPAATWLVLTPDPAGSTTAPTAEAALSRPSSSGLAPAQPQNRALGATLLAVEHATAQPNDRSTQATFAQRTATWRERIRLFVQPWLAEIAALWIIGVAAFSLRPLLSWLTVRNLRRVGGSTVSTVVQRAAEQIAARLRLKIRNIQILESTRVHSPLLIGCVKPLILLPLSMTSGMPLPQIEAILAHELAHIRRHDYLVNVLQTLVETVFFYHPAVWWLSAILRRERENCCDDMAVAVVGSRVEYGRALLALEESRSAATPLAIGARNGLFLERVRRLFEPLRQDSALGLGTVIAFGTLLTSTLLIAIVAEALAHQPARSHAAQADSKQSPEPTQSNDDELAQRASSQLPKRTQIATRDRSAIGWQSSDQVRFVLYAQGELQPDLVESVTRQGDWQIKGTVQLIKDGNEVRRFKVQHSSADPKTLHLDDKAYLLGTLDDSNTIDSTMVTGRLFILREQGEPIQTARTIPLTSAADLDASEAGSLAFSADLDLWLAETYALSRALAAEPGWVIAWDIQHPIQHGDGARIAKLRIFADGRVAAWAGIGEPLIEGRIDLEQVTALVNWLIDEKSATPRSTMDATLPDGKKTKLSLDPLPGALWDQEGNRVGVQRGEQKFDLVAIVPEQNRPAFSKDTAYLSDEILQRLQQVIAAAGVRAAPAANARPETSNGQQEAEQPNADGDSNSNTHADQDRKDYIEDTLRSLRFQIDGERLVRSYPYFGGIGGLVQDRGWREILPLAEVQANAITKFDELIWSARKHSYLADIKYLEQDPVDYRQYISSSNGRRKAVIHHAYAMVQLGLLTHPQSAFVLSRQLGNSQAKRNALLFDLHVQELLELKLTDGQREDLIRRGFDRAARHVLTQHQWQVFSELTAELSLPSEPPDLPALSQSESARYQVAAFSPPFRQVSEMADQLGLSAEQKQDLQALEEIIQLGLFWNEHQESEVPADRIAERRDMFLRHAEQLLMLGILTHEQASRLRESLR